MPLSWRTRNYVGTIFGGSMNSAVDPIYMVILIRRLGKDEVVWDKPRRSNSKNRGVKRSRPALWSRMGSWRPLARRSRRNARSIALLDRAERFFGNRLRDIGKTYLHPQALARCETLRTHRAWLTAADQKPRRYSACRRKPCHLPPWA
jgi:hypothetical protein